MEGEYRKKQAIPKHLPAALVIKLGISRRRTKEMARATLIFGDED